MMEELMILRKMVEEHDYVGALAIINELDEMAKDDKINKVESFLHILLLHLIKQQAEGRTSSSWQRSINYALFGIEKSNKRRSAGGYYLSSGEMEMAIEEAFEFALIEAAIEAFGGVYSPKHLAEKIDTEALKKEASEMITTYKLPQKDGRQ